jgi:hypothetical protein
MSIKDDLLTIERGFWSADAGFYEQNLDDVCVTAFATMAGAFRKQDIAAMIKDTDRWRDLSMNVRGFLEPVPGFAILTYDAKATRKTGDPYAAVVSSGYVMRNGAWKMAFHQQTPVDAGARK